MSTIPTRHDVGHSRRSYTDVLGGTVARSGERTNVALANSWIVINRGEGPTDDKPAVILETPRDLDRVSSFLNIRVKDVETVYAEWSARGAQFLTPPKQHQYEIRCYIRDPRRLSDRGGANHGPRGGLDAPSMAVTYARRGVRANAGITGERPHIDDGQPSGHRDPGLPSPVARYRKLRSGR